MVFMVWLAVVFGWFTLTVFRGARNHFAWGALWSAIVILGATNLMNPDAFIVRTNVELMQKGRAFDRLYNSSLSADSVPTALSALPSMSLEDQCYTKWMLHNQYRDLGSSNDLRSLNFSRRSAFFVLRENDSLLHELEGCPEWVPRPGEAGSQ
jgi:hypothetical protein